MPKYTILGPIWPPERCYLSEVLLWRAFGRYPEESWIFDKPWRFSGDIRDTHKAPILNGEELSDEECLFAGISSDPRMNRLFEDHRIWSASWYQRELEEARRLDPPEPEKITELEGNLEKALQLDAAENAWLPAYQECVDEFQNEICLDLRRRKFAAFGTELPEASYEQSELILEERGIWLDALEVVQVPAIQWISTDINWIDSTLFGRERSFVWIHVKVEDMVMRYPPEILIKGDQIQRLGENFAVASSAVARRVSPATSRGRPPLSLGPVSRSSREDVPRWRNARKKGSRNRNAAGMV
jgi:hypothetical protein